MGFITYDLYENTPTNSRGVLCLISKLLEYHWKALIPITVLKLIVATILVALNEACRDRFGGIVRLLLWIVGFLVGNLFLSTFAYAFHHALVQIYAVGNTPSPLECIQYGYMQKWHVFWYLAFVSFLHVSLKYILYPNLRWIYITFLGVLDSYVLILGIPIIVAEQKSAMEAVKRSFTMFRENMGFLFWSRTNFLVWGISLIMLGLFSFVVTSTSIPTYFLCVLIFFVSQTVYSMVSFILYMSIRIRKEGITQETFAHMIAENGIAISSVGDYCILPSSDTDHDHSGLPHKNVGVEDGVYIGLV